MAPKHNAAAAAAAAIFS